MINLIIDAANEKIIFTIIANDQSYTTTYLNSRENFDKFMKLILNFFKRKKLKIYNVSRIFINLGPGKFTSLRISLSTAKALSLANNASLIGFKTSDLIKKKYENLLSLDVKKFKNKGLIKPIY